MQRPLIKICGVTSPEQAVEIAGLSVDAIGINFVAGGKREVATERGAELAEVVRGQALRVGVFMDADALRVEQVLRSVELDWLQFHGGETAAYCRQFGLPYVKTLHVGSGFDFAPLALEYGDASALLLDTLRDGQSGGTGQRFDWRLWPSSSAIPLVLAGGLTPANVAEAVQRLQPYAVDVASGVEDGQPGIKQMALVRDFVREVAQASDRKQRLGE